MEKLKIRFRFLQATSSNILLDFLFDKLVFPWQSIHPQEECTVGKLVGVFAW